MYLKGFSLLLTLISVTFFLSCTKVNESTNLGDDLIPAVDNVTTFDTTLEVSAAYFPFDDSTKNLISDNMALGRLNDPLFGATNADMYFNLSSNVYAASPFVNKDSVTAIDSVVLSLSYQNGYGDTATGQISVQVSEIASGNGFFDTIAYRFDHPGFATTGSVLGSRTFSVRQLKDSVPVRLKSDSSKVVNVLRIRLNNSIGEKLRNFGYATGEPYLNDSLFRTAFRGLAVKTTNGSGSGALAYFSLSDNTNTKLLVYYRYSNNGIKDTTTATFVHKVYSQANSIRRTASGSYASNFNNQNSSNLYIQSSPQGSYVGMKIDGLSGFPNKVIHRAELIAYKITDPSDATFGVPSLLFLDHKGTSNAADSAYMFDDDLVAGSDGSLNYTSFGGFLKTDNSYRFNITRYVQSIATKKVRNDSLRLFAPLRTRVYSKNIAVSTPAAAVVSLGTLDNIAKGRVVLGNRNYPDPSKRMRLRIIYSNL